MSKTLDVICIGRIAVDFYAQQIGSRLEDVTSMAKYLGGSSGNVAYGTARQGLNSAMLARVGNDHMGRFLKEELGRVGCSTDHLMTDTERLTALVVLGIEDQDTFPLIFYRENCADMALCDADIQEDAIARAKVLHITGTHFSTPTTNAACRKAIEFARKNGTRTSLDIDYRPVLWGLTGKAEGENRFVANDKVTEHLQSIVPLFDLIVGTEEELHIAGGTTDTLAALRKVRELSKATIVLKRGALGASVYTGEIPEDLNGGINGQGVRIEVLNVLGAGDAFMSGLLRGFVREEPWEQCLRYANACGALVVSRHGCAPAMPSVEELDYYLAREQEILRPDLDEHLNYLHRVTCRDVQWPELNVLAFDHRLQLEEMCDQAGVERARIKPLKRLILEAARQGAREMGLEGKAGILCDDTYGQDTLNDITGKGWWIGRPVELPGSRPLRFEHGNHSTASVASRLTTWPSEHVVKCLCFYHPDDEETLRLDQEHQVQSVYNACLASGHEFLLELIPPKGSATDDQTLVRSMERFYDIGVRPDWWKVPSPSRSAWLAIESLLHEKAPHCRGVILLGLDAPEEELKKGFNAAAGISVCKGFMVGRTIFGQPSKAWLAGEITDDELVHQVTNNYIRLIQFWQERSYQA
ncbi:bifunctional 5-dehydro-2-deoxygluconokinase/5-dehydro-2-deoxyphosphogluconate aldolase [Endozoicomonas elysicola]|uniref:5-dehydro-2-deoxygluconokinase n=1 Tax=Endozoicomonas elysicola TaxID=305900 RepID=A0A081K618_9GAMM|nr:5-dehydro-2-deoxygluconokinase [Endozoicomonas elysicola]KEI69594.1 5-dehydro-2-deoxygluconokinase [Endozoicomonas elysicola]